MAPRRVAARTSSSERIATGQGAVTVVGTMAVLPMAPRRRSWCRSATHPLASVRTATTGPKLPAGAHCRVTLGDLGARAEADVVGEAVDAPGPLDEAGDDAAAVGRLHERRASPGQRCFEGAGVGVA